MPETTNETRKYLTGNDKINTHHSDEPIESLTDLKEETNNVMASVLAEILKLKQDAISTQEASRLMGSSRSPEEIKRQLEELSRNFNLLHRWCLSSTKQIESALQTLEETKPRGKRKKAGLRLKLLSWLKS